MPLQIEMQSATEIKCNSQVCVADRFSAVCLEHVFVRKAVIFGITDSLITSNRQDAERLGTFTLLDTCSRQVTYKVLEAFGNAHQLTG